MSDFFDQITEALYTGMTEKDFTSRVTAIVESTSAYVLDDKAAFQELEGCEKSIFGVKFEKRFTSAFDLPRKSLKKSAANGSTKLDTIIAGYDVDIKTTLGGRTWMIPSEARGQWCLLLQVDYKRASYALGVLQMSDDVLTNGLNQDKKASVNADGKSKIEWIIPAASFRYGAAIETQFEPGLMGWV